MQRLSLLPCPRHVPVDGYYVLYLPCQSTHSDRLHPISLSMLERFDNSARLSVENIYLPVVASCDDCMAVVCECHTLGICFYWLSSNQCSYKVPRIHSVNIEPISDVVNYAEPMFQVDVCIPTNLVCQYWFRKR
jgi:hypothetical protein